MALKRHRVDTAAFRSGPTGPGVETVDVTVEPDTTRDGVVLRARTPDGESWHDVAPELLEQGLAAIFTRQSQLERTAARFGLSTEDLLAALARSAVDLADPSGGLPAAEREALRRAGISLDGSPQDPSGAGQVALGLARGRRLRDEALTVAQAATALAVTPGRVRQLVSTGAVVTLPGGESGHLLPAWQIVDGRLLPGLESVATAAAGLHPLTLAGFMTRPDADLVADGEAVSPVDWLLTGGDPDVVAQLVVGLRVAA
ncbi:hypothetical protein [Lapillicoccus jejuensis]|uniref:Excisionase family DNA binding protein n=1 Tax=Lapillicoccus jejuensis TaxID=402171 RepID=A0A542DVS1_9MICO|nr:hypothetical protein [Lapillicoccus jejuensis]TQJ07201.1 hypothetical protein FB458_0255 [Lapillicoccus jejuensis]